jgi:hypothetical protein
VSPTESATKKSLKYTFEKPSLGPLRVALAGAIDENADLVGLFDRVVADTVFNFRDVARVNSMGVHSWVPLVSKASARHKLKMEELSYALVQSANAVANMFGSAELWSCIAPYYCTKCKQNVNLTITAAEVATTPNAVPEKRCARCHSALEFDELDGYFAFFKARARK